MPAASAASSAPAATTMARARSPLEVLALHQFPEGDAGGCTANDGWGLAVSEQSDNEQMAEHQIEMLAEAGFQIVRGSPRVSDD